MKTILVLMRNYYKKLRFLPCRLEEWEPWLWKQTTYKIINKLAPVCLHDLVHMTNSKYSFRYNNILEIPQIKSTRYDRKSFRFAAPTLWNSLPDHFRTENSFSGMGQNVAVLHVDDYNFASGLLIFFFIFHFLII